MDGGHDELTAADSIDALAAVFVAAIAPFGFTACACGAYLPAARGPEPHFFFQHWPAAWTALYTRRNFHAADFSVAEARRRLVPFTWVDVRAQRTLSRAEQDVWDTVNAWGWSDGLSIPIHGPGGYFGLVAMAGTRAPSAAEQDQLHLLALRMHDRCRVLTGLATFSEPEQTLTTRELECLRWVAAGKTDWEIARIVGLSRETAKTHVDAGRRKLGAATRAVARLVLCGLC
ncbi:MAG: hypothetical protein GC186_02810 [Rhodobacteraceae bacterium]|nr:hypothetical protein [Paracoccaceae bacterium]